MLYRLFLLTILYTTIFFPQRLPVTVFLRIDDIFMRESPIEPMECDSFLYVAEKHNARVMLAVIPGRLLQKVNAGGAMSEALIRYSRRGHQLVQHGYNHLSEATQSTDWEFYDPKAVKGFDFKMKEKVAAGKQLIEAVIGTPVTSYVGPGNDNDSVLAKDEDTYRAMGFSWLTNQNTMKPYIRNGKGYFFSLDDYAWALTEENYLQKLAEAQSAFLAAATQSGYFGLLFHDHFTRAAYNHGITVRWLEEMLSWFDSHPEFQVQYRTCDEWFKENSIKIGR